MTKPVPPASRTTIVHVERERPEGDSDAHELSREDPAVGRWFWYTFKQKVAGFVDVKTGEFFEERDNEEDEWDGKSGVYTNKRTGRKLKTAKRTVTRRYICCCIHLGSNYALLESVYGRTYRIHFNDFFSCTEREEDFQGIITQHIVESQKLINEHVAEAQRLLADVNIPAPGAARSINVTTSETQALARLNDVDSKKQMDDYKTKLVTLKEKTIPTLFKRIKEESERMTTWMSAPIKPIEAEITSQKEIKSRIEDRIFNVQLYAGLVEEIEQVGPRAPLGPKKVIPPVSEKDLDKLPFFERQNKTEARRKERARLQDEADAARDPVLEGVPAPADTPVHLFQRRLYMDEECLIRYQTGGFNFTNIRDFDRWICRPENLTTLLPHPRCIVAFQVRRHREKGDDIDSYEAWARFNFGYEYEAHHKRNRKTYLYMRNGADPATAKVYRLTTEIEFGEQLFPDQDKQSIEEESFWARVGTTSGDPHLREISYIISNREYDTLPAKDKRLSSRDEDGFYTNQEYHPFSKKSVYFDDIQAHIKEQIDEHNRLVLVLQGIFDRSEVMHPHPTWRLWTPEGFSNALKLVYDNARALVSGEEPNFELYMQRLAASIKPGSTTIGQEDIWSKQQADIENERRSRSYRRREYNSDVRRFFPEGNPGPGFLAVVQHIRKGRAVFKWEKMRRNRMKGTRRYYDTYRPSEKELAQLPRLEDTTSVPLDKLFHVDAYTPGDYHVFFDDPRTRADYMKWAPFMLAAEEWHAGNRSGVVDHDKEEREADYAQHIADGWEPCLNAFGKHTGGWTKNGNASAEDQGTDGEGGEGDVDDE